MSSYFLFHRRINYCAQKMKEIKFILLYRVLLYVCLYYLFTYVCTYVYMYYLSM